MGIPKNNPERKNVWSSIYYAPLLKYWMISNATPMYDGDEFLGMVGHDVTLDVLFETMSAYQNTVKDGQHLIVSAKGVVMYEPAYKTLSEEKAVSAEITLDQTRFLLTCAVMPSVGWYYVQLVPYRAILAPVYSPPY